MAEYVTLKVPAGQWECLTEKASRLGIETPDYARMVLTIGDAAFSAMSGEVSSLRRPPMGTIASPNGHQIPNGFLFSVPASSPNGHDSVPASSPDLDPRKVGAIDITSSSLSDLGKEQRTPTKKEHRERTGASETELGIDGIANSHVVTDEEVGIWRERMLADESRIADWSEAYPGVDVASEIWKMSEWMIANPGKHKTVGGLARFRLGWFSRAQNQARGNGKRVEEKPQDYWQD